MDECSVCGDKFDYEPPVNLRHLTSEDVELDSSVACEKPECVITLIKIFDPDWEPPWDFWDFGDREIQN